MSKRIPQLLINDIIESGNPETAGAKDFSPLPETGNREGERFFAPTET